LELYHDTHVYRRLTRSTSLRFAKLNVAGLSKPRATTGIPPLAVWRIRNKQSPLIIFVSHTRNDKARGKEKAHNAVFHDETHKEERHDLTGQIGPPRIQWIENREEEVADTNSYERGREGRGLENLKENTSLVSMCAM
jgi:hypothetical protein